MEMTGNEKQGNLDSWDGFLGSVFLDVDDVKSETTPFVCVNVEMDTENARPIIILEVEGLTKKLSLNVTNANFVKDKGITSPRELMGKKIFFRKSIAFSPKQKKDVPTLRIADIQ